jgi:ADP-ribosylglycohydrolase
MTRQPAQRDRARGALWGMFVADALAMPAHWYYDVAALRRDFGTLRDYQAPPAHHPNSILPRASTSGAGRGAQQGDIVGEVILQGKKHLWGTPHRHYHHGLAAGDNTLNLLCARLLLRTITAGSGYDPDAFLRAYIEFMTAPDSHGDTYAESYHRDFFANFARGVPPRQCAGREGHDTASIGGLVSLPIVILASMSRVDETPAQDTVLAHLRLTHRSDELERYALALTDLFTRTLCAPAAQFPRLVNEVAGSLDFPAAQLVQRVQRDRLSDVDVIGGMLSPACYIDQSFPAVLYLAARYPADLEAALIANANVGGDNCHRGAVLGAVLGAALGVAAIPARWIEGLRSRDALEQEIEGFLATI